MADEVPSQALDEALDAPPLECSWPGNWSEALSDDALLVASAPFAAEPHAAAVLPVSQYVFDQVLFGFEAQLRAFAHVMGGRGRSVALAPLPEIFATRRGLAAITRALAPARPPAHIDAGPEDGVAPIVHLRFGPARHARVLKGARNVMVLADDPRHLPIDASVHPFGGDIHLPAPFSTVLAYAKRRSGPVLADGCPRHERVLDDAFVHADLDGEAFGPAHAALAGEWDDAFAPRWYTVAGLHVRSFAELARDMDWMRPSASRGADAMDWRRALARAPQDAGPGAEARQPPVFIMLPWNLASPASIVPDLIQKLGRREPSDAADDHIVLFPFNATPDSARRVEDLVAATQQTAGRRSGALRGLFIARLPTPRDARSLRRVFPLAWLEADDPESAWTGRRLAHLGIGVGLLGGPVDCVAHRFAIAADEPIRPRTSDCFGDRCYATRSLSARQLATLLVRSRDAATGARRA